MKLLLREINYVQVLFFIMISGKNLFLFFILTHSK